MRKCVTNKTRKVLIVNNRLETYRPDIYTHFTDPTKNFESPLESPVVLKESICALKARMNADEKVLKKENQKTSNCQ